MLSKNISLFVSHLLGGLEKGSSDEFVMVELVDLRLKHLDIFVKQFFLS